MRLSACLTALTTILAWQQVYAQGRIGLRQMEPDIALRLENQEKIEFQEQIKDDLIRAGDRITALYDKAHRLPANRRNEFTEQIRQLTLQRDQVENQLSELRASRPVEWGKDKVSMLMAVRELESAINRIDTDYPEAPITYQSR